MRKRDEVVEHVAEEGSREHVIYWTNLGRHCSELNCEVNKQHERLTGEGE